MREWRAERLTSTGATTVAKSYRLLKAVLETAADDELIRRNPCRIRGAGTESATEREIVTVEQVDALADAVGPRWRLMVYLGAYGPMRPEEQAELRRKDVDLDSMTIRVRRAAPELSTGARAVGETKSEAGKRYVVLPGFLHTDLRRHLDWYAEKEQDGLLFVGGEGRSLPTLLLRTEVAEGASQRRDAGRLPLLRPSPHRSHAVYPVRSQLKDTMVRAGPSSEKAALIYQHSDRERQKEVASGLDKMVRVARKKGSDQPEEGPSGAEVVRDA